MEGMFGDYIERLENILDGKSSRPTELPFSLLNYMTRSFSKEREIGSGGFGVVYRGEFKNRNVAVKKLTFSKKADEDFDREIGSLMMVNHDNVVRFLGYCNNTTAKYENVANPGEPERLSFVYKQERILCFEYVNNGSLTAHIHDELRGLEWHTRFKILKDICQALDYLHNIKKLVHRDLKPDNILLDNLWVPKIADLGISKLLGDGKTQTKTTNVSMSLGYTAPEFKDGVVSFKYDIFSLGVIIIELVTGVTTPPDVKNVLTRWRHRWNKSNETLYYINRDIMYQQVQKCIEIGISCKKKNPRKRPTISKIIEDLNDIDGANRHVRNSHESPGGQETPCWNDLVWVEPPELFFPFQINKEMSCPVVLKNEADAYMAFFIKTNSQLQYRVDPNKGVIEPRSHLSVNITLLAQEEALEKMLNLDEFIIKSKKVNKGLTAEDITKEIFSKRLGNIIDKTIVGVVFDEQLRAPCTVEVKKLIDFPSKQDQKQHTSSDDSSLQSGSTHVEINGEERIIIPPIKDDSSLQPGIEQAKVNDEDLMIAPPNSDYSSLHLVIEHVKVNDEEPTIVPTNLDDWTLQSGTTHVDVHDDEPTVAPSIPESGTAHVQVNDEEPTVTPPNPGRHTGTTSTPLTGQLGWTRSGLDLVLVLDVSSSMREVRMQELMIALQYVMRVLSLIDRLSIVTYSFVATELCSLQQMTESSRRELVQLIYGIEGSAHSHSNTINIEAGLRTGLKVLADREVSTGRSATIILMCDNQQGTGDATKVNVSKVPVYTFGFGSNSDHTVLKAVAANSRAGSFSQIPDEELRGGLTMAFSKRLDSLFWVSGSEPPGCYWMEVESEKFLEQAKEFYHDITASLRPKTTRHGGGLRLWPWRKRS